jgi:uncharacterized protein
MTLRIGVISDTGAWAKRLAGTEIVEVGEIFIYVIHDLAQIDIDPEAAGVRVVISGHSHQPLIEERDGILYFNPGSSGPRRFKLPIPVGEITITGANVSARVVEIKA